jgi:hypothetical protein
MREGAPLQRRAARDWAYGAALGQLFARAKPDRVALVVLTLANVALVVGLPVLGGHDLPQHLAYARILADYDDPALLLRQNFTLPDGPQAYFTTYYLLAVLARATSVMTACRLVYAAYAIALPWAVASLVSAASEDTNEPEWSALLGPLLVWNPVACMGFLPFMLALPTMVFAAAALLRAARSLPTRPAETPPPRPPAPLAGRGERERGVGGAGNALLLSLLCTVLVSTHIVAAALFCAFAGIVALSKPGWRSTALMAVVVSSSGLAYAVWSCVGPGHLAHMPPRVFADAIAKYGLWDGSAAAVGARWSGVAEKVGFLRATVLGCLPELGKSVVGLSLAIAAGVAVAARPASDPVSETRSTLRRALVGLVVLTALLPASLSFPDDICLIDFRAIVMLVLFGVAAIDPRAFDTVGARRILVAAAAVVMGLWTFHLAGLSAEGEEVLSLVQRLRPGDTLLALPFHDRSEYLDEDNGVTHYLPVYHTVLNGGVTSLFWGKFSHHLPVGYRPGKEPLHPPDWKPWEVTREALDGASSVLVQWPDPDDDEVAIVGAAKVHEELQRGFRPVDCRSRWCLYQALTTSQQSRERAVRKDEAPEPSPKTGQEASRVTRL